MRVLFESEIEGSIQKEVKMEVWREPEGLWQMEIPSGFVPADEERKRQYFPYDYPPETVLFHEEEDAWITVQLLQKEMKSEETLAAMEKIRKLSEDTWPQYEYTPIFLLEEGKFPAAWFAMTMEDEEKEHLKAVFSPGMKPDRMALLTFTYPQESSHKWRSVFGYLLSSIDRKGEEGGRNRQR